MDSTSNDGFVLNNGYQVTDGSGVLLVGGEAFGWRPWANSTEDRGEGQGGLSTRKLVNKKGQWDVEGAAWGVLRVVWPKPGR